MSRGAIIRGYLDHVKHHRPVALATLVEFGRTEWDTEGTPLEVGGKLLLDRSDTVVGTLGNPDFDAQVEERAREFLAQGRSEIVEIGSCRVFVEVYWPAPRLVIIGAVHIAVSLSRLAREMGFRVVVSDARDRFATPDRFPDVDELILGWPNEVLPRLALDAFSYVVVITHDAKLDNPALVAALNSEAPYVGALGSRRTHARRVEALKKAGVGADDIGRIHAPIGLEIGARSPAEIALATMAQIVAARNGVRTR